MNELIKRAIAMRRACLWRGRGRPSTDNFAASIGRLEQWIASHPHPSAASVRSFASGIHYRDFLMVVPSNHQGATIAHSMNDLILRAHEATPEGPVK